MEEAALQRRERLRKLKENALNTTDSLKASSNTSASTEIVEKEQTEMHIDTLETETEKIIREASKEIENSQNDLDVVKLAPKKVNWDLKRDLEQRMEKLEKQTQKAIDDLIKSRLAEEKTTYVEINE